MVVEGECEVRRHITNKKGYVAILWCTHKDKKLLRDHSDFPMIEGEFLLDCSRGDSERKIAKGQQIICVLNSLNSFFFVRGKGRIGMDDARKRIFLKKLE